MILEVCWDGLWALSFGLSQFHGHGYWLVCEVALSTCESIPSLGLPWAMDRIPGGRASTGEEGEPTSALKELKVFAECCNEENWRSRLQVKILGLLARRDGHSMVLPVAPQTSSAQPGAAGRRRRR